MALMQAEERVARLGKARILLYSFLPLLTMVALLEGGARAYEFARPGKSGEIDLSLGFNPELRIFTPFPNRDTARLRRSLREGDTPEEATFLAEKPAGTYRIFVLGGSSVVFLQRHLEALEARLSEGHANNPGIELINAGKLSFGSQRLLPIAQEVMEYNPDLLVLYTGHNEFEDLRQLELSEKGLTVFQKILTGSALYRVYWHRSRERQVEILQSTHNINLLKGNPFSNYDDWKRTFSRRDLPKRMQCFQQNVEAIVALCRARGVPILMGTVPSNYWEPALESDGWEHFNDTLKPMREAGQYEAYFQAMDTFLAGELRRQSSSAENGIILEVARKHDVTVADVLAAVRRSEPHGVPGETLFGDSCHLNDRGNALWIETFAPLIEAEIEGSRARVGASTAP